MAKLERALFDAAVAVGARVARSSWHRLSRTITRVYADFTLVSKGATKRSTVEEVAAEWQRMFPRGSRVSVREVRDDTAYGEIHALCPLRATGDVDACYRMMEYDRRMLESIGGQFVVLRSQAEPGVTFCEVAIRKQGTDLAGLEHAHERVRKRLPVVQP